MKGTALLPLALVALLAALPASAEAQGWKDKLKAKAREKLEQAGDKAVDKATGAATEAKAEEPPAETEAAKPAAPARTSAASVEQSGEAAPASKPGEGAWANFDFVPGSRPLYVDDFSRDVVGDFPRRMEFKAGALEIIEWSKGRWLRASEDSRFYLQLPEVLPERWTMEFDYSIPTSGEVWISFGPDENKRVEFGGYGWAEVYNHATKITASGRYDAKHDADRVFRARVMADGRYVKVYVNDKRVLNVPNADLERSNRILFYTDATVSKPSLFGNFSVMAGGKKLYEALAESGRVATQGILFDTGSDRIRPESTPTLKEIARMLEEHADLELLIEGHTDDVGQAAANQTLSEQRAVAVKAALVESFGVSADRLTAAGFGASKPAGKNDTAEGRQMNRRVELVKK
ncbi:MAG TPA: OmpA family protein [Gemmatimonadaceae bacterium]|nr:OmpA family protein [Gemmatimonadaceae bacterium]